MKAQLYYDVTIPMQKYYSGGHSPHLSYKLQLGTYPPLINIYVLTFPPSFQSLSINAARFCSTAGFNLYIAPVSSSAESLLLHHFGSSLSVQSLLLLLQGNFFLSGEQHEFCLVRSLGLDSLCRYS